MPTNTHTQTPVCEHLNTQLIKINSRRLKKNRWYTTYKQPLNILQYTSINLLNKQIFVLFIEMYFHIQ